MASISFPALCRFQFHKGTIRTVYLEAGYTALPHFNSIKVRLEQRVTQRKRHNVLYFNSIKVRLEPFSIRLAVNHHGFQFHKGTIRTLLAYLAPTSFFLFQFHKGTIRTIILNCLVSMSNIFQFHKGTIRTCIPATTIRAYPYFNSIKVRLEQKESASACILNQFQFHKGTIRTFSSLLKRPGFLVFQFHKGTIRTLNVL